MPMNLSSLHCMWSDRNSGLSLTSTFEFFFFFRGWTYLVPVWTLFGPVFVPCGLVDPSWIYEPLLDRGSFMGFWGPLVNFWLDHCWTVLDSWVILSLGFQLESFVPLPCSEGLQWVVTLEISAGFIGWKLEFVGNWEK